MKNLLEIEPVFGQVPGSARLPDARLELNVHELFIRSGRSPGPWIGESIELGTLRALRNKLDARDTTVAEATLEYVVPRGLSTNTIACALLARIDGEICSGVQDDDLPAAQCFVGNSELVGRSAHR